MIIWIVRNKKEVLKRREAKERERMTWKAREGQVQSMRDVHVLLQGKAMSYI